MNLRQLLMTVLVLLATGCGQQGMLPPSSFQASSQQVNSKIIVGNIEWYATAALHPQSAAKINSRAVGYISIPSQDDNRCTAFLISPSLIMTNWHCFPTASSAANARFYPEFERGVTKDDYLRTPSFDCSQLVINNEKLDFALLRCQGNPGLRYGYLQLETNYNNLYMNEPVYVIHQNCDFFAQPNCPPIKLYSPGQIVQADPTANAEAQARDLFYNSDTLGGSSGSPVFSQRTNRVVAIHHYGHSKFSRQPGRGTSNSGVPMSLITHYLRSYYPNLR